MKHISEYVDELDEKSCIIPSDNALMFCYFNNLQYFYKYLRAYTGKIESTDEQNAYSFKRDLRET